MKFYTYCRVARKEQLQEDNKEKKDEKVLNENTNDIE